MPFPEAGLINCEITLREMQLPQEVKLTRKSLVRWLALAMGLVSPNESRTILIDLLESLFYFQFAEKQDPNVDDLIEYMEKELGRDRSNEKAVRYHLLKLQNMGLLERRKGRYSFAVSPLSSKGDFSATIDYVYKRRCDTTTAKIKEAFRELTYLLSKRKQPEVELVQFIKKNSCIKNVS